MFAECLPLLAQYAAGSMHQYGVRQSVCPYVCPVYRPLAAAA